MFTITRIFNDNKGDSHFEEVTIPLSDEGLIGSLSEVFPVSGIIFREVEPSYDWDFHNAPQRQFIILLDGEIEIETSDGNRMKFKGGDIILAEDTKGKGHRTKNILNQKRRSIFVTLPPV